MREASVCGVHGDWEIQLPAIRRRWITLGVVGLLGVLCGLSIGPLHVPIVGITFFLAAVSGVCGLWSP
jgi:hypothetical protein